MNASRRTWWPGLLFSAAALTTVGCSQAGYRGFVPAAGDGGYMLVGGPPDLTSAPPDLTPAYAYPPGPYGNQKGNTIVDVTMAGYRLTPEQTEATELEWAKDIKLGEYHLNKACKCLLITWGASWCTACKQEQPQLIADVTADKGFCVLNIVQEGITRGVDATRDDVDNWNKTYHQNFYVTQGTRSTKSYWMGYGPTIGLPFNFIVNPKDMKLAAVVQGYRKDIHTYAMGLCGD